MKVKLAKKQVFGNGFTIPAGIVVDVEDVTGGGEVYICKFGGRYFDVLKKNAKECKGGNKND